MIFIQRGIVPTLRVNSDVPSFPRVFSAEGRVRSQASVQNGRGEYFSAKHRSTSVVITPSVLHTHQFISQRRCTNLAAVCVVKQNTLNPFHPPPLYDPMAQCFTTGTIYFKETCAHFMQCAIFMSCWCIVNTIKIL